MVWYMIGPGAIAIFGTASPAVMIGTVLYLLVVTTMNTTLPSGEIYGYANHGQNPGAYDGINSTGFRRLPKEAKIVMFKQDGKCKAFGIPWIPCNDISPQLGETGIYTVASGKGKTLSPIVEISCGYSKKTAAKYAIKKVKESIQGLDGWNSKKIACGGKTIEDLMEHIWVSDKTKRPDPTQSYCFNNHFNEI